MLRFRLFGVPFEVAPYFWIFSAILGSNVAHGDNGLLRLAIWVACVFVSIVIHEMGHALAARYCGLSPAVLLYTMGGLTVMRGGSLTRPQGVLVSLAGPVAGFALYGLVGESTPALLRWYVHGAGGTLTPTALFLLGEAFSDLLFINLIWTLFNLLPILPLDGGQVLRNLLGPERVGVTRWIGVVCAGAVCVWAALHQQFYVVLLMGYLGWANLKGGTRPLPGAPLRP